MKLYDKGVYLVNGMELVEDTPDAASVLKAKTGIPNIILQRL